MKSRYEDMSSHDIQRVVVAHDLMASTSLKTMPAHFDPIFTPIFTAIGFTGSITIGAATISTASLLSAIATTAVVTGLQLLLTPKPPKPDDGKAPLTQAIPYRIWIVGRCRVAGAYMLWEAVGSRLFAVQAIAGHRIAAVTKWWLHDDVVTLNSDKTVQALSDGRYGDGKVWLDYRLGANPETPYSEIVSRLAADDLWTDAHRGDGQASLALIANNPKAKDVSKRFPYGIPRLSAEVRGAFVWDYRDPAQDPENPATWVFSMNSALIMCWHQCFSEFGHRRDYRKAILPVLDMWKEEADICDEDVPTAAGGTEKRYECCGWDTTEHDPKIATNAILATCDGWICERGDGALLFTVGKFRESRVGTLTDADITGHQVQYDVLFSDEINRLIPKFTYPATDYTTSDTDYFEDTARQLTSGRVLAQDADYGWVQQWRQARRLGKREWLRIQQRMRGNLDIRLSGINAIYYRWVRLSTPVRLPRLDGKVIENRKSALALQKGAFNMQFIQHPDDIETWTPATDEGQVPPVPPAPNAANLNAPVLTSVVAVPSNGSVYLRATIVDPGDDSLTPSLRYRIADIGGGVPGDWVEKVNGSIAPSGGFISLTTDVVPSGQLLEVEAAFINSKGTYSDWSAAEDVQSISDPVAPIALTSFTNIDAAPHLGRATLGLATGNDSHVLKVQLFRVANGLPFDPATSPKIATLAVSPNGTYSYVDGDATCANLLLNPNFDSDTVWIKGSGWTISGGSASKTAGVIASLYQAMTITTGDVVRSAFTVSSYTAGNIRARLGTAGAAPLNDAADRAATGTYLQSITATGTRDSFALRPDANFVGSVDNTVAFKQTTSCAPQGVWDYYAVPLNVSGIPGPSSGPITVAIV